MKRYITPKSTGVSTNPHRTYQLTSNANKKYKKNRKSYTNTACPNKNLTIFERKISGYKWKFWNKFGLLYNDKGLKSCLPFVPLKRII